MAESLDTTPAPRRAAPPQPSLISRLLTPRTALATAAVVGISATAIIVPALTQSAVAANQETPTVTQVSDTPGTLDSFTPRGNTTSRDMARPALNPADAAKARAASMSAASEQIAETNQQAVLSSRTSALESNATAIAGEEKRIKAIEAKKFYWPTAGGISSWYGPRRHPILGFVRLHAGVDIGGACGQPIWAVRDGVVASATSGGGSGNMIRLDHGKDNGVKIETAYLHMQSFAVKPGQRVKRGQVIGSVGNTGLSTACHLHFSAYTNGKNVDPVPFLRPGEKSRSNFKR